MASWFHPQSRTFTLLIGVLSVMLIVFIIIHPGEVFQSSLSGLKLWWDFVFPGLFPFLMLSEMLLGLGVIHAIGAVLEPWMRLIFRLPGTAGWAFTLGLAGGFPAGSSVMSRLTRQNQLQPAEAQRLWAVSHLASPMLVIAVIGVGFLNSVERGFFLAVIHYGAAVATALVLLAMSPREHPPASIRQMARRETRHHPGLWRNAARTMTEARRQDGRTFGKLLGDSVTTTAQTLFSLGGFIMLFSVIHQILKLLIETWSASELSQVLLAGLLEPHLGVYAASHYTSSAVVQTALIGGILGWSGLSLHAQARGLASPAGLRYGPFLLARLTHAALAVLLTFLLWKPAMLIIGEESLTSAVPSMSSPGLSSLWLSSSASVWPWIGKFYLVALTLLILIALVLLGVRKVWRR